MAQQTANPDRATMSAVLDMMKAAHIREGAPSAELRIDRLERAAKLLKENKDQIVDALCEDFGHRSRDASLFSDVVASVGPLDYAKKHVRQWMQPQRRPVEPMALGLFGARAELRFQPKGVVGVLSPWNFPFQTTFTPLAGVLAAGNRAMIKPSEFTARCSALMGELFPRFFAEDEIQVFEGGPDVGAAFTSLPFDHMIFTGSTAVGRHVMRAAADNLVPVTLELGGKSPVIVGESADIAKTARRVMNGKTLNAGQICLAPDYVMAPAAKVRDFADAAGAAIEMMFPGGLKDNDDYTSIINQRHFDRLRAHVEDARSKGADIVELNPKDEDFSQQPHHKLPPTLILGATDDMTVMQEEIFGPVLPVRGYGDIGEAIAYVNAHDRPLGLYYFGENAAERDRVLDSTTSGGVTVNDVLFHIAQESLPFGGVGPSGMGAYHGHDGFLEFSHRKSVFRQLSMDKPLQAFRPPYGDKLRKESEKSLK